MMLRLCVEQLLTELGYKQKNLVDKIKAAAPADLLAMSSFTPVP